MGDKGKNKDRKDELTTQLRDSIQASIDHAQAEREREMFKRRLELARTGLQAYHKRNLGEAVRAFLSYISVLEKWKKVSEGHLTPSAFDKKTDAHELLLISGVYFDLAKIYDRTKGDQNEKELRRFLHQYYIFSKGMSYEPLSAETLRRYIRSDAIVHKQAFKEIYKKMTGHNCFVVTSLVDHVAEETPPRLRQFRDEVLEKTLIGRQLIALYYRVGPSTSRILDRCPEGIRSRAAALCDRVARRVSAGSSRSEKA